MEMKTPMMVKMMSDDFCAFILTHGRPNNVVTFESLKKHGYTGKVYIVIDDEDKTADEYREKFGDKVLMFSKEKIANEIDEGDNFHDRRAIIYARNACFELAEQVGCKYFIQLDDDYNNFRFKVDGQGSYIDIKGIKNLDAIFSIMLEFYKSIPALTIAMGQGGDFFGGKNSSLAEASAIKRKAMNTFFCSTDRKFKFFGRLNEDVNVYTNLGRRGHLIFSIFSVAIQQLQTQANSGGMTEIYLDQGTYFKSFYSILYSPSCVKISVMGKTDKTYRIHHHVKWNNTAPKIMDEKYKKNWNSA